LLFRSVGFDDPLSFPPYLRPPYPDPDYTVCVLLYVYVPHQSILDSANRMV